MSRFTAIPADVFTEAEDRYDTEVDINDWRGAGLKEHPRQKTSNNGAEGMKFEKSWKRIEDKFK